MRDVMQMRVGEVLDRLNLFKRWRIRRRMARACNKWNAELDHIKVEMSKSEDAMFKWNQLVWQEVWMYIRLDEPVDPEEFRLLCDRRGFTPEMRYFLVDMLKHVGLGRRLA
jgi:hypothetical protein